MSASIQLSRIQSLYPRPALPPPLKSLPRSSAAFPSASPLLRRPATLRSLNPASQRRSLLRRSAAATTSVVVASVGKLSETELILVSPGSLDKFPSGAGVYAVYDEGGDLQFVGISRNIAASVSAHSKMLPDLCCSVKVGLVDGSPPDRTVLTGAWKSWVEEHISVTGKVPPGNETGNKTWVRQPQKKPNLRLTPGRHVQLTVPLEELIDQLVKENKIVAFIKGSRSAPQCGFSQRVVGILESHGVDFECVDVLDEEHNSGLRETLKKYSNWPTFPQVFVGGEFVGGCDIVSSMAERGELAKLFQ